MGGLVGKRSLIFVMMARKNLETDVGIWNPVLDHPIIRGPINTDPLEYKGRDNYETNLNEKPKDSKTERLNSRLKDRDYK